MSRGKLLGQGAQFAVYQESFLGHDSEGATSWAVAVKQPKLEQALHSKFSLADPEAQKHLHDIWLEILALTHPRLHEHPNVVSLLGWGMERHEFHSPLTLVMDLASCDLTTFLGKDGPGQSPAASYGICVDVAAGLDQLHKCGLIHSDIKPQNVLMFEEHGRFVAKLADFGLSVDDTADMVRLGGTPGWQAPEVEAGNRLSQRNMVQADSYSYGLLIWSTLLYSGDVPPQTKEASRQYLAQQAIEGSEIPIAADQGRILWQAIQSCLEEQPDRRPITLLELFPDGRELEDSLKTWFNGDSSFDKDDETPKPSDLVEYDPFEQPLLEDWELSPFAHYYADDLLSLFMQDPRKVSEETCFALFLHLSALPRDSAISNTDKVKLLCEAASRGYSPARELLPTACRYYKLDLPGAVTDHLRDWLMAAVAEGSILGRRELGNFDTQALADSLEQFRRPGGYNRLYSYTARIRDPATLKRVLRYGLTALHCLAAYGTMQEMTQFVDQPADFGINTFTRNRETPLYLASLRGSWEMVMELLLHKADPSICCTEFNLTCLHWLFCFEDRLQGKIASELIARGADINARATQELPFLHYPFRLPAGTPLHWAVVTSSQTAVKALFENGFDVLVRDKCDPYAFDDRIRYLNKFGGQNLEAYSIPDVETMGLSPLDYSAMQHDPYLFDLILSSGRKDIDINAVDEEGFAAVHRLSAGDVRRTRLGNTFSSAPFRGTGHEARQKAREIVRIIKELGGNLDLLTTTTTSHSQRKRPHDIQNLTPLMLAMMYRKAHVIEALLEHGANPHIENELGNTALLCTSLRSEGHENSFLECVRLLASYGADINHCPKSGQKLIITASHHKCPDVVDYLLSNGASIDERDNAPDSVTFGQSVWALLARREEPMTDELDRYVARLLEKHVCSLSYVRKVQSIVEQADQEGCTMLHEYASCGMHYCVSTLLRYGVDANPDHGDQTREWRDDVRWKITTFYTPLDMALKSLDRTKNDLLQSKQQYTKKEYESLCEKYQACIRALESKGGRRSSRARIESPI